MGGVNDLARLPGYRGNPKTSLPRRAGFNGRLGIFTGFGPLPLKKRCDGVAKADVVGLHLGPCGETTKTRAAIVTSLRWQSRGWGYVCVDCGGLSVQVIECRQNGAECRMR